MFENCFEVMPRFGVAAQPPVRVKRREERAPTTLIPVFVLTPQLFGRLPVTLVNSLGLGIRPTIDADYVLIHICIHRIYPNDHQPKNDQRNQPTSPTILHRV
jgi:hypothetical protein